MSLRKVSDLQGLNISHEIDEGREENIKRSLFEISYLSSSEATDLLPPRYSFASMYTTFEDVTTYMLSTILSNGDTIEFHDHVHMLCGLCVSGNMYLNLDMTDDEVGAGSRDHDRPGSGYEMFIHTTYNTLCAVGSDPNGVNHIYATNMNIIQSDINVVKNLDGDILAQFDDKIITFNRPLTVNNDIRTSGDIYGNTFHGTAVKALWADVAELYESDMQYSPGTLVKFGGSKEITIADDEVNAVVTDKPGLILNQSKSKKKDLNKVGIALTGRTPVKVLGQVRKFDKLCLSTIPGVATKKYDDRKTIAIAMKDKFVDEIDLVECVVKLEF